MKPEFFRGNRQALVRSLQGGLVVLSAYGRQQNMNDMAHAFTQEANFWYLCGIEEPDWKLIVDGTAGRSWLVMPTVEAVHATFDGELSPEMAQKISGVDKVVTNDEAARLLRSLARQHSLVHSVGASRFAEHFNFALNPSVAAAWQELERTFGRVQDIAKDLAKLRAIKQPDEIRAIKKAIKLTAEAFEITKNKLPSYTQEYQIEADFSHHFRWHGARGHAYDPIIASGGHACTLHYTANSAKLKSPQLVLMDIGARVNGYAADITRTYARGQATKRQRQVHEAVRRAQAQIIALLAPNLSVERYMQQVDDIMKDALKSLGLLQSEDDYRRYFPHAISHGLGVDVHDSLGGARVFAPGMVLTVEPGIYIPEENIGVRIEDDIAITEKGHENLSRALSTEM